MTGLTNEQVSFYHEHGYIAPLDVFTASEAAEMRAE